MKLSAFSVEPLWLNNLIYFLGLAFALNAILQIGMRVLYSFSGLQVSSLSIAAQILIAAVIITLLTPKTPHRAALLLAYYFASILSFIFARSNTMNVIDLILWRAAG